MHSTTLYRWHPSLTVSIACTPNLWAHNNLFSLQDFRRKRSTPGLGALISECGEILLPACAGQKVQEAIAARLKGYPQKAQRQMHRARVLIPAKAAAVLRKDAQLAGPAVEAFYNRDADDMRAAAHMAHFPPQV